MDSKTCVEKMERYELENVYGEFLGTVVCVGTIGT